MNKKFTAYVAILIISMCVIATPAFAATTTLTTSVPHDINVEVVVDGHGVVVIDNAVCKEPGVIEIPHNENITITATPDSGWVLQSAMISGEDFTDRLQGNSITLEKVTEDFTVHIQFQKTATPQTGDVGIAPWLFLMCISAIGLVVLCSKNKAPI